ncbi:jg22788 [Pararge aegeria aegeria]|uniref:Jg22788 protein n=1 Tax=Pararge aegeria aegeria TaxID=348720 RepID=A0A8S4QGD0_9NEOP|nr:jg22788 [Pararge aegeria aegeria]
MAPESASIYGKLKKDEVTGNSYSTIFIAFKIYLEIHFDPVYEEEDNHYEEQHRVAAIKDVLVEVL